MVVSTKVEGPGRGSSCKVTILPQLRAPAPQRQSIHNSESLLTETDHENTQITNRETLHVRLYPLHLSRGAVSPSCERT